MSTRPTGALALMSQQHEVVHVILNKLLSVLIIKLGRLQRRLFLVAPSTDDLAGRLYKVGIGGG